MGNSAKVGKLTMASRAINVYANENGLSILSHSVQEHRIVLQSLVNEQHSLKNID